MDLFNVSATAARFVVHDATVACVLHRDNVKDVRLEGARVKVLRHGNDSTTFDCGDDASAEALFRDVVAWLLPASGWTRLRRFCSDLACVSAMGAAAGAATWLVASMVRRTS